MKKILLFLAGVLLISACSSAPELQEKETTLEERIDLFNEAVKNGDILDSLYYGSKIDSFYLSQDTLQLFVNDNFTWAPFREENVTDIYTSADSLINSGQDSSIIVIYAYDNEISQLIPNFYRNTTETDLTRNVLVKENSPAVIRRIYQDDYENGLTGKNVVLWHSHGWYYSNRSDRWEWQRARLFQSVEDLIPMSITIPFLIPMLENSGANVFVPRERDIQTNEVVIDNNTKNDFLFKYYEETDTLDGHLWKDAGTGFAYGTPPYKTGDNPFRNGTARVIKSSVVADAMVKWTPEIPETGEYAVYVSWLQSEDNVTDAHYTVNHAGGSTDFLVNQQKGGGTWMYLGTFKFNQGYDKKSGVILTNESSQPGKNITADAVRFGGGMGLVERNGTVSGRPKFIEGARYWLQYAGMPDTLVYSFHDNQNDYNDDYKSRGEYANYLTGAPFGPNVDRSAEGLHIPIDVSMAFHTDAGITDNDTTIGTLMIYSIPGGNSEVNFPDGVSRFANRDFADIVQTQIVNDLHALQDTAWTRRQLRNAMYSESFRPNMPSLLLELLSHQNFTDMKFMLDPRFKFDVARAMYKGVVKFISSRYGYDYVIQPLPVDNFEGRFDAGNNIKLSWKPVADKLEPTASPTYYKVYTRIDDGGFDNGIVVDSPEYVLNNIETGKIYSFKITALNAGGESFPSEVLAFGKAENEKNRAIIVNGFDRISAPSYLEDENIAGFTGHLENGVAYKYDLGLTGYQYDFSKKSEFISNDAPGYGASLADYETTVIAGNTFDYSYVHGKALMANGWSFVSVSDEAVENNIVNLNDYIFADFIYGEEKSSPKVREDINTDKVDFKIFTPEMMSKMKTFLDAGNKMFISGAYLTSEVYNIGADTPDTNVINFTREYLKFRHGTDHAARKGEVILRAALAGNDKKIEYYASPDKKVYNVESPDEVNPVKGAESLMYYNENSFSASIGYNNEFGVVVCGFPFETIKKDEAKQVLMNYILNYLTD